MSEKVYPYPKQARLRRRADFQRVAKKGKVDIGRFLVIESLAVSASTTSLGITVTKRFGKAHDRNYFKRLVREAFRHLLPFLTAPSMQLVVKPRAYARQASYKQLYEEMKSLLKLTLA